MRSIALLVPSPCAGTAPARWREVFSQIEAPLRERGLAVEAREWSEPGQLDGFDLVLPLLAWGYHRDMARWRDLVTSWIDAAVPLSNPGPLLLWNADKIYIEELAAAGVPVVPTRFVQSAALQLLEQAAEAFGTDRLVVKPRVSASAWQTAIWSPRTQMAGGPDGPALIQPFVEGVRDAGELSLIFIGGELSHSVRKLPKPGDFRVQPELGGSAMPYDPALDEIEVAEAALAVAGDNILYARCDLVRRDGRAEILELELIEPELHLGLPLAGQRFADAVVEACRRRSGHSGGRDRLMA